MNTRNNNNNIDNDYCVGSPKAISLYKSVNMRQKIKILVDNNKMLSYKTLGFDTYLVPMNCLVELTYEAKLLRFVVTNIETGEVYSSEKQDYEIEFDCLKELIFSLPPKILIDHSDNHIKYHLGLDKIILDKEDIDEVAVLRHQVSYLKQIVNNHILGEMDDEDEDVTDKKREKNERFLVTYHSTAQVSNNSKWKFDQVVYHSQNYKDAFQQDGEKIIVLVPGLYQLSVAVTSYSYTSSYVQLEIDNVSVYNLYNTSSGGYQSGFSCVYNLVLKEGSAISLKNCSGGISNSNNISNSLSIMAL
eukprot:TRINITY_DN10986_c0_g1_i1.p1 TRINITY_DN10986_c0_g1~~TRINITY_DN10986_c0_g1_i1.p1  ORF type:complete len:303 (+),score=67.20 TRINITY_DN10986_c0_g1_i1:283-1191(+)